jgi:hypothetical protein
MKKIKLKKTILGEKKLKNHKKKEKKPCGQIL